MSIEVLRCMVCQQETASRTQKGECPACQLKKAQRCEHWVNAFCLVGTTVLVHCMNCDIQAAVSLDGNNIFTTHRAQAALSQVIEAMSKE